MPGVSDSPEIQTDSPSQNMKHKKRIHERVNCIENNLRTREQPKSAKCPEKNNHVLVSKHAFQKLEDEVDEEDVVPS